MQKCAFLPVFGPFTETYTAAKRRAATAFLRDKMWELASLFHNNRRLSAEQINAIKRCFTWVPLRVYFHFTGIWDGLFPYRCIAADAFSYPLLKTV